ncbi:MAG: hybrid sensor histidine kinase/response regulator [Blastochloris sp.]|nr:hybrid sensor histidine kinase/response regulator [Blastochloris sp.]
MPSDVLTEAPPPPHILVVNHEDIVLVALRAILEPEYRVSAAKDLHEALDLLDRCQFDMAIVDDMMPHIDGLAVLRAVRQHPQLAHLPVSIYTTRSPWAISENGMALGADDYIIAPFNPTLVKMCVRKLVERKRLADENARLAAQLHEAQQAQVHITRIMAHELKGPLTNLRMAQFLLRDIIHDDGQVQIILDNIDLTLDGMSRVISTFLEFEELRASAVTLKPTPVQPVIEQAAELHVGSAMQKMIRIHVLPTDGVVQADPYLLAQVMSNLVSNAVKYGPHGSMITVGAEASDHTCTLFVADQGAGVPVNERHKLFQMFGRLSTRPTGSESSTGLGLWIVKQLIEVQRGSVGAHFPDDGGSIFRVTLPAAAG